MRRFEALSELIHQRLRLIIYVASFIGLVITYTALYRWGMATFEGENRIFIEALGIVVQSLTTTGYGQDAPWQSTPMSVLVMIP